MIHYFRRKPRHVLRPLMTRMLTHKIKNIRDIEAKFMANIAMIDYYNYYKISHELYGLSHDVISAMIEESLRDYSLITSKEISDWMDVWIWKWRQRVKLVMDDKEFSEATKIDKKLVKLYLEIPYREELKELIIGSLVRSEEVCFTELLAENILKASIVEVSKGFSPKTVIKALRENPILILDIALRKVKKLKHFKGHLILVKVENRLFDESRYVVYEW